MEIPVYIILLHGCKCGRSHVEEIFVDEKKAKAWKDSRVPSKEIIYTIEKRTIVVKGEIE